MNNNQGPFQKNIQQIHGNFKYFHDRRSFLTNLLMLQIERVLKYLFLTNSGGAIAVLSFMGASGSIRTLSGPKWALGCFVFGIIMIGFLSAYQLFRFARLKKKLEEDISRYSTDKLGFNGLVKLDKERSYTVTSLFGYICGCITFASFIIGCIIGIILLFKS